MVGNFLYGFTLYHAHYTFIRVTNDLVYYREGGRQKIDKIAQILNRSHTYL